MHKLFCSAIEKWKKSPGVQCKLYSVWHMDIDLELTNDKIFESRASQLCTPILVKSFYICHATIQELCQGVNY